MPPELHSPRRAAVRLSLYLLLTLSLIPFQLLFLAVGSDLASRFPRLYHRLCCRLFGFHITVHGKDAAENGDAVLYISNHSSYLDIMTLGAVLKCSFIAKAEVADWPFFGLLAKLQRTVFVDRRPRRSTEQKSALERRLAEGDNIVLFAEGTSSDGNRVLPFKSSLFAALPDPDRADAPAIRVQPVTVVATRLDGLPMGRGLRPAYAWYGDMDLPPHLWGIAGLGRVGIDIYLHPCIQRKAGIDRKKLARAAQAVVAEGMQAALSGRNISSIAPSDAISGNTKTAADR